ncbi:hypothetical protein PR003_g16818 [Phytophthora rubi]|uniref:Uncharacterized protein n=1 Tax=Phytophthora rubi TaxID=129364 RepID=A0A6A3KIL8_9STRA|nr:hypothetical protein PR002_g16451 [Phytophthora rubi]KAE9324104.1 hypothetical protein PR003_g16818 [Phytophthora rubi]
MSMIHLIVNILYLAVNCVAALVLNWCERGRHRTWSRPMPVTSDAFLFHTNSKPAQLRNLRPSTVYSRYRT